LPRHSKHPDKVSQKETIGELWNYAMEVAKSVAAKVAEVYDLPYEWAFALYDYIQRYSWNALMFTDHRKGWHNRHHNLVFSEADFVARLMKNFLTTIVPEERSELGKQLDMRLKAINWGTLTQIQSTPKEPTEPRSREPSEPAMSQMSQASLFPDTAHTE